MRSKGGGRDETRHEIPSRREAGRVRLVGSRGGTAGRVRRKGRVAVRFGLIGYGAFGRVHARTITRLAETELAAIACGSAESAEAARADHPGVGVVTDWRELLADPSIAAVNVVVPNHLHAEIAQAALAAGKHVLLEKPMATTIADCDRLVAAAARAETQLSVGHELRFSTQWAPIRKAIAEGRIGRPRHVHFALFRHPFRPGADGWRQDPARVGSWTLEELVHFFDLVLWYLDELGPPVSVRAFGRESESRPGLIADLTCELRFEGGAHALITQTLEAFEHHVLLEIAGSDGAVRTWWSAEGARSEAPRFELKIGAIGMEPVGAVPLAPSGEVFELEEQIRQTARAFAEGRAPMPAEAARRAVVLCLETERALREGKEIRLAL